MLCSFYGLILVGENEGICIEWELCLVGLGCVVASGLVRGRGMGMGSVGLSICTGLVK